MMRERSRRADEEGSQQNQQGDRHATFRNQPRLEAPNYEIRHFSSFENRA
jgi:hypothetical protein